MAKKTNAVRLVEQAKIPCREQFYEFDENDFDVESKEEKEGFTVYTLIRKEK